MTLTGATRCGMLIILSIGTQSAICLTNRAIRCQMVAFSTERRPVNGMTFFDNGTIVVCGLGIATGVLVENATDNKGKIVTLRIGYVDKMTGDSFVDLVLTKNMLSTLLDQLIEVSTVVLSKPNEYL